MSPRCLQLVNYCHHFLEEYEEQIVAIIRDGVSTQDLTTSMCQELSGVCMPPARRAPDEL